MTLRATAGMNGSPGPALSATNAPPADNGSYQDGLRGKPKKAPNAFRTISEVADELHIPQHVSAVLGDEIPAGEAAEARRRAALLPS